jgi:hypothetical protein
MDYKEKLDKSYATSWHYSLPVILKEMVKTIDILKKKLSNNKKFVDTDLPELRTLYKKITELSEKNKKSNKYDISEELKTVQQMFDIINSYYDDTKLTAGVEKRITRTRTGSELATVASFYYKVGNSRSYSTLKLK